MFFFLVKDDVNKNTLKEMKHIKMGGATMHHWKLTELPQNKAISERTVILSLNEEF